MPENRLGLYQAVINRVVQADGQPLPDNELCDIAWNLWSKGERRLQTSERFSENLRNMLVQANVIRVVGADVFFRHDLMQAYLAARWAGHHAPRGAVTKWLGRA